MEELIERYFERLNNFKKNSCIINKDLLNYKYGELYGILDSLRVLNIVSFKEYLCLMNEIDKIYNNALFK